MNAAGNFVALEGIRKAYGGNVVVDDVDLAIRRGEFVVLLGPSGCGKTTTLRIVAGFVTPDRGHVSIDGRDVTHLPPRKRGIGMVFQSYALFPTMTVAQNVAFSLEQRREAKPAIRRRVDELLALVQLHDYGGRLPAELSGGQQQRVALARAIASSPSVLLMDEPLGALDLKLREAMQRELRRLQQELGITSILVTHDQNEAMSLADRIVLMAAGRIQQVGTPDAIYRQPCNAFVADFIGKVNVLTGRVVARTDRECIVTLPDRTQLDVAAHSDVACDDEVNVVIRPESVRIGEARDRGSIAVTVASRRFLGNIVTYVTRTDGGQEIVLQRPSSEPPIPDGTRLYLGCEAADMLAFPVARPAQAA